MRPPRPARRSAGAPRSRSVRSPPRRRRPRGRGRTRRRSRRIPVPESLSVPAQALHQLLVPRLGAVVRCLVLFGVLGQDQRSLEVAGLRPGALDDGAPSLGEEIWGRALVPDGNAGLAVGEGEGEIEVLGLPLERPRLDQTAEAVGLAWHRRGQEFARRHEVDDGLAYAGPDEIGDGRGDDESARDEPAAPAHSSLRPPRAAGSFELPLSDTVTSMKAAVAIAAIVPDRQ